MATTADKDFGPIADDYAFFERHATEAEEDARAHTARLRTAVPAQGTIRMLDFGCGSGAFTERLLRLAGWAPERVEMTLVEPVHAALHEAVTRLAPLVQPGVTALAALPDDSADAFDFVLVNHVLYYVTDLERELSRLLASVSPEGVFMTAIAARTNALAELWLTGFRLVGLDPPYRTSEDLEAVLRGLDANYEKEEVPYELTFQDTEGNRMRILRFLLADHLATMPRRALLDLFDRHSTGGRIRIRTTSDHFTVRSTPRTDRG